MEVAEAVRALVEPVLADDPTPIYALAGDPMTEDIVGLTDAVRRYPEVYPALLPLIRGRAESVRAQLAVGISAPEDLAFVEGAATVTVAAAAPEGVPAYVVVQGRAADGPWRTLGVRPTEACSACTFEFALSIPSDVAHQRAIVLLDTNDDDWMDAGTDGYGAQESDDWTFDVTADQIWTGEPAWVSKFGAPIVP